MPPLWTARWLVARAVAASIPQLTSGFLSSVFNRTAPRGLECMAAFSRRFLSHPGSSGLGLQIRTLNHAQAQLEKSERHKYLFVHLNQRSMLDAILACAVLPSLRKEPVSVFANIEFLLIPLFGWALWMAGAQMVVRQSPRHAKASLNTLINRLQEENCSFMMSIEGRRSRDGEISPYRKGAAIAATRAAIDVVPYVTRGTMEFMKGQNASNEIVIEILPPISIESCRGDKDALMQRICDSAEIYLGTRPTIYSSPKR